MSNVDDLKKHPAILNLYRSRVPGLKRDGKELVAKCCLPGHKDDTPSFRVYEFEGVWLFRCFGCNISGNIFQFIQRMDNCEFKRASQIVENFIGSSWTEAKSKVENVFKPYAEESQEKRVFTLAEYRKLEDALEQNNFARQWLETERGISYETARKLHFGYKQDIGKIAGDSAAQIADKGWIVHPVIEGDNVVAIEYRSLLQKEFRKQPRMKTAYLFNLDSIDPLEPIILTEGIYDAAVLVQAGFSACSLPNGSSAASPEMKDALLQADSVILAGDMDQTGQDAMQKLWNELQERTYLLHWPEGCKDANETFLKHCGRNIEKFRALVLELTNLAKSKPIPHVYSLAESMKSSQRTNLSDHPLRLRFPWSSVDSMAVLLPGSVMSLSATNTKQGKTQFCTQLSLYGARYHNEVVLNYQAELDIDEFSNIVAAHVLKKSRNSLTHEDYVEAGKQLSGIKYYIGRNPVLNTVEPVLELMEAAIRRLGATLCIVDHIHFLTRNTDNEIKTQADAMQKLKNLAVKYGCKIIVVSQPRKAQATAKGKVLHVTDIKGSETLTSDADAIFVIHRETIKDKNENTKDDYSPEVEIHLLGARSKGSGSTFAKLYFLGDVATFSEMAHERVNEEPEESEMVF